MKRIMVVFIAFSFFVFLGTGLQADDNESNTENSNVCGTSGTDAPDKPFGNDFTDACKQHDQCYENKDKSKSDCDNAFKKAMDTECKNKTGLSKAVCKVTSFTYKTAVVLGGTNAYRRAQGKRTVDYTRITTKY